METVYAAPGLRADWLNGWLAAVGVTRLLPDVRLSWMEDLSPHAVFHGDSSFRGDTSFLERLLEALPSADHLSALPTSRASHSIDIDTFTSMARESRLDPYLGVLVTDQVAGPGEKLPRGEFNAPAPQGVTIFARYERCRRRVRDVDQMQASLSGTGHRVEGNGLGFDFRRLRAATYPGEPDLYVDPVVECLCFAALPMFPVRGDGARQSRTRGWLRVADGRRRRFTWGSWAPTLDQWGVDALIDSVHRHRESRGHLQRMGVTALFESVEYQTRGASDVMTGFASRRLW